MKTTILITALALTCFPGKSEGAIIDGLVGHWTFDEASGDTAADSSGQGNTASVANFNGDSPIWSAGKIGNALTFRGPGNGDDFVTVPDFPKPSTVFSVSAWALADPRPTWPQSPIVENGLNDGGPIGLVIRNKNVDQAFGPLGDTTTDSNGTVAFQDTAGFPTASWQQVGVVADGTQIKLYRNGVVVAAANYSGRLPLASGTMLGIGVVLDAGGTPLPGTWQGQIDDVGVWTNALTATQMAAIYTAGQAGKDLSQAESFLTSPPTISTQPQALTRFAGEAASLSVVAAGTGPFTYQWKRNNQPITGATNATYSITSLKTTDAGDYVVVVGNSGGTVNSQTATVTINSADLSTALIGYWKFDETQGDEAADSSSANHAVTLVNYPAEDNSHWVAGQIGGALQINGVDSQEYGVVEEYTKPASTITISAWVWADSLVAWSSFLKNWGDASAGQFHFGINSDAIHENIYIKQADGKTPNVSDPNPFPTNSWQQVAFVCDGVSLRLYRNGTEVASTPYDGTLVISPMNCIGFGSKIADACDAPAASAVGPWQGKMDDVGIWARGLNSQEIFAIFKAGQTGKPITEAGPFIPTQPVITSQPISTSIFENVPLVLKATATGADPLTYQWFKDGQIITNANAPTLDLGRVSSASAGHYKLHVSNALGSTDSDEAVVVINQRPPATLVSEWKFENNLNDTSGNANDATTFGELEYVSGKFGMAVRLAPGNPIISDSASNLPMNHTNSWSMNLWVNLSEAPTSLAYLAGFGPVTDRGGGTARALLAFSGTNANNIYFWGSNDDAPTPMPYPLGRWAMITIIFNYEEANVAVYLDDQQIALHAQSLLDVPDDANQISLAPTSNWGIDVGGDFDEFTIWNGVLLPSQLSTLFDPTGGPVQLAVQLNGLKVLLSWPASVQGFILQSADTIDAATWSEVTGVSENKIEIPVSGNQKFFRLKK